MDERDALLMAMTMMAISQILMGVLLWAAGVTPWAFWLGAVSVLYCAYVYFLVRGQS